MIIIYSLLALIAIMELSTFIIYGGFISKQIEEVYMDLDESALRLNPYDHGILCTNPYIASVPFSVFAKYHISGIGRVPRWSKLHKRINEYFAIAAKNGL